MKRLIRTLFWLCIGLWPLFLFAQEDAEVKTLEMSKVRVDLDSLKWTLNNLLSNPENNPDVQSAYIHLALEVGNELLAKGDWVTTSELIGLLDKLSLSEKDRERLGILRATNQCEMLYQSLAAGDTLFYAFHQALDECVQYEGELDVESAAYLHAYAYGKEADWLIGLGKLEDALSCLKEQLTLYESIQAQEEICLAATNVVACLIDMNRVGEGYELLTTYQHRTDLPWEEIPYASFLFQRVVLANNLGKVTDLADIDQEIDDLLSACENRQALFYLYHAKGWLYAHLYQNDYLAIQWYQKNQEWMDSNAATVTVSMRKLHYEALSEVYLHTGDFEQALAYCLKEAELIEPENKSDWVYIQTKLSAIYEELGQIQRAKELLSRLMDWCAKELDPSDESHLIAWHYWLMFCYHTGDWTGFIDSAQKALTSLTPKVYGNSSTYFNLLLWICYQTMHTDEAVNELATAQIKELMECGLFLKEQDEIDIHLFQAELSMKQENIQEAVIHYRKFMTSLKEELRRSTLYLNRQAREKSSERIFQSLSLFHKFSSGNLLDTLTVSPLTEIGFNVSLLTKAYLLQTEQSIRDLILKEGSTDDWELYLSIEEKQALLTRYQSDSVRYATELFETQGWLDRASAELLRRCNAYGDITGFLDIDYQWVKAQLGEHEYLVDFLAEESRWKHAIPYLLYSAYIVDKAVDYPLWVRLLMDIMINDDEHWAEDFYQLPDSTHHSYYMTFSRSLADLFRTFEPGATIYYVPTHRLHKVDLSSIPLEDGSLLGDHYRFVRISSANQLRNRQDVLRTDSLNRAVLFGGLSYDLSEEQWLTAAVKYSNVGALSLHRSGLRGNGRLAPLPGTATEVRNLGTLMRGRGWTVEQFSGSVGTAEAFLALNGHAPKVLHIATHGFYYEPNERAKNQLFAGLKDAMALSGLAFAGANAAWTGKPIPQGVHNGIVTAQEIARMDLTGLELVVLSACETAEGKITNEGIYGLQRAFKKAGAETIVMSLWPVSDQVTKEFMDLFYQALLDPSLNGDKIRAFNRAKGLIRTKYEEPVYWAGFVMLD